MAELSVKTFLIWKNIDLWKSGFYLILYFLYGYEYKKRMYQNFDTPSYIILD